MDESAEDIVATFRRLVEANEKEGNTTAASVYEDAANHVEEVLVDG